MNVYIKKSSIHGKGLFAARAIKKGELIGNVVGNATNTDGPYVLWINDKTGVEVSCHLRFINHSETPNACYYDTLEVAAIRDINVDEEITHNYSVDE